MQGIHKTANRDSAGISDGVPAPMVLSIMVNTPAVISLRPIHRAACLVLALCLLAPAILYAEPSSRQVLILHSYSQEYPWTRGQHEGFIQTLAADAQEEFLVSTEYLDTKRRAYDETYASELARHLRFKYENTKLAAIYLTDDNALLFVRDHLSRVFPGVPVFFSGINDYGVRSRLDPALFTGVFERKEFAPNIEWLLSVDKNANDLLFIGDGSNTDRAIESALRGELIPYRLRLTFLAEKRLDRALGRLRDLPGKYAFLTTLGGMTDEKGQVLPLREIIKSIVGTGRIVISMEDAYIIEGVLGGYVTSGREQGRNAARLLLAHLHGKPMVDLPPILKSPNAWIFDDRSLVRFGIRLPDNVLSRAFLLHPRPGFYERFRSLILGILIALAVSLVSVVTASMVFMSRKNRDMRIAQTNTASANALFHQLAEQTRTMHWEVDAEGLYTYVSDISREVTGYRPDEIIGRKHIYDLRPAEGREAFRAEALETLARRHPIRNLENILQTRDQRRIWVATNGIPLLDGNGNLAGYRGSDTDITERKQAEEVLSEAEVRQRTILNNMPFLAWLKDTEGRYNMVNQPYATACGRTVDQVVGLTDLDIWPRELAEKYRADDAEIMRARRGIGVVEQIADVSGTKWFETYKAPILNLRMEVTGTTGLARDITDRKRAEEEKRILEERLNRAEKMEALGLLAGGVAHDLNNVLGVIVGYSELLLHWEDASGTIRPKLEEILKGGQRAAAIVEDLLALARRGVPGRDVVSLNRIIADLFKLPEFQRLSSFHPSVKFRHDLDPDLPNISGSPVHLGKTLFNLVSNGCEAMPKGGVLTIRTAYQYLDKPLKGYDEVRKGDHAVLSVSDTGGGIADADLQHIFEPFYTKKILGRSGTGLGLAVVWGTVKDHDGYINVQSEEGIGSTFTLYFPVARGEITVGHEPVPLSKYMGKGESILIVDDVKEQRVLATEILKKLNYTVSSVASGEEAVVYLKDHPCDLLILDMIMDPGMDGLDTYKKVLEVFPGQKAVIVSGFSESDRVHAAQALGAGGYVRKPYVSEKLGMAVRKELDRTG
jgi:PAS domain S-box-containing protein